MGQYRLLSISLGLQAVPSVCRQPICRPKQPQTAREHAFNDFLPHELLANPVPEFELLQVVEEDDGRVTQNKCANTGAGRFFNVERNQGAGIELEPSPTTDNGLLK